MQTLNRNFKLIKVFFVSLSLIFSLGAGVLRAPIYAVDEVDVCNPTNSVLDTILDSFGSNIITTALDHFFSVFIEGLMTLFSGVGYNKYMGCTEYVADQIPAGVTIGGTDAAGVLRDSGCRGTDEDICMTLMNQWKVGASTEQDLGGTGSTRAKMLSYAHTPGGGSLIGMTNRIGGYLEYEPLPVNTAYFFGEYAKRLPLVGEQVLAADNTIDYQQPFLRPILDIWRITRNAAYAMMALVMLYVGITVILRKQVNQKLVVTVQYSLPKIAVALVLIAFSYPIGALIASLGWSLFHSAGAIANTLSAPSGALSAQNWIDVFSSIGGIISVLFLSVFTIAGIDAGGWMIVTLVVAVVVVLALWVQIKALFIYYKMLISIVTAPIEFAVGAIPGNEDKTMNWFKKMISHALGLFAMGLAVKLVHVFGVVALYSTWQDHPFAGGFIAIFAAPIIFIYGYFFAMNIPQQVENFIVGAPKKR